MNFLKDLSIDKIQNLAEDAYNQAKPKTDVEARVYEVLSHKNWGASGSLMNEIARDTFDQERFYVVTRMMWDGMENQRPAAWRVVFKSLTLLEYLVKNGAERCVDDARNHGHVLRALGQFNYYEGTIDRGLGVREKSKQILEIVGDDERIREERQKARKLRDKFGQGNAAASGGGGGGGGGGGYGNQDSWNNSGGGSGGGGGYGDGGIYDNNQGYSGRYGNEDAAPAPAAASTPTFAAMPEEGTKKKLKKKKKKPTTGGAEEDSVSHAAAAPEPDLLAFDVAPVQAPLTEATSEDFGAFQTTAPVGGADFDAFGDMRSAPVAQIQTAVDPFAAPGPAMAPPPHQPQSFDAFGNSNSGNMGVSSMMMGNSGNGTMGNMSNAFGNMNITQGVGATGMQQLPNGGMPSNDDDFGDFTGAAKMASPAVGKMSMMGGHSMPSSSSSSGDPLSKLINLDGLSKNPSRNSQRGNLNNPAVGNSVASQYPQNMQQGVQHSVVVSAGGSDAISSMFAPGAVPQQQQQGMPVQQQPGFLGGNMGMTPQQLQMQQQQQQMMMMNQGNNMMGGQAGMGNSMAGGVGMQGAGGMGGMNNMMGGVAMQGAGGIGSMNTMGMQGGGMNQMGGMQPGMNQMGGMQPGTNQMGGMQPGMQGVGMNGMGMQGGMNNMSMQGGMGGQQQQWR